MFKRTRTEGRASQLHEFLSSGWYSCNSYAISKDNTPQGFVLFVQFVFSKIKRQILPDSNIFFYTLYQRRTVIFHRENLYTQQKKLNL